MFENLGGTMASPAPRLRRPWLLYAGLVLISGFAGHGRAPSHLEASYFKNLF